MVGSEHQAREHQGLDLETGVGRPVFQRLFDAEDKGGKVVGEAVGQHDHQLPEDREDADLQKKSFIQLRMQKYDGQDVDLVAGLASCVDAPPSSSATDPDAEKQKASESALRWVPCHIYCDNLKATECLFIALIEASRSLL
jgi:hypothetical protein